METPPRRGAAAGNKINLTSMGTRDGGAGGRRRESPQTKLDARIISRFIVGNIWQVSRVKVEIAGLLNVRGDFPPSDVLFPLIASGWQASIVRHFVCFLVYSNPLVRARSSAEIAP